MMLKGSIKLLSLFLFPISLFSNVDTDFLLINIEHDQSGLYQFVRFDTCWIMIKAVTMYRGVVGISCACVNLQINVRH